MTVSKKAASPVEAQVEAESAAEADAESVDGAPVAPGADVSGAVARLVRAIAALRDSPNIKGVDLSGVEAAVADLLAALP